MPAGLNANSEPGALAGSLMVPEDDDADKIEARATNGTPVLTPARPVAAMPAACATRSHWNAT
ncbi:MAG: hypothetical protein WA742_08760 [Candidatus Cybelea sp.]